MGQNQSAEKTSSRSGTPQAERNDRERRVNRRTSVPVFSYAKGTSNSHSQPADASASTIAAHGRTTNVDSRDLERMLHANSPELTSKSSRGERSTSKKRREKEIEARLIPQPLAIPGPAPVSNIDIPTASAHPLPSRSREQDFQDDAADPDDRSFVPVSHHRPPRLPLPIAENDNIVFEARDTSSPIRRNSMLSVATQEEEDLVEELQPFGTGQPTETVPYTIEWKLPADRVFVTGTFAAWDKKYRLRRSDSGGVFRTTINLPPGTHHLKFFVDNQMMTSPDLPTAVDFNNILVNYVEISTDDIPKPTTTRRESTQVPQKQAPSQATVSPRFDAQAQEDKDDYSGNVTPKEAEISPMVSASLDEVQEVPEGDFRQLMPQALNDIDAAEDDQRYKQAAHVIQDSSAPPSLPLFLSRSILNTNAGVKDDSSVLALPNHTVLNHLMTSNVRNGVLATSVTTRYKKKYVTTISFKPVPVPEESN